MKFHYFLFMLFVFLEPVQAQYNVSLQQKVTENIGGFSAPLDLGDEFGYAVESIGDLNGDGINDLAVSARQDDDGGFNHGAVYILFLNNDGTVNNYQKISDTQGSFLGSLDDWDIFGSSISYLGDMNGDGLIEIGVGAEYDGDGGYHHGAIYILSLNPNGTVNSHVKISDTQGGFTGFLDVWDVFGTDIALLGDLDGDGNQDIAVGSRRHSDDNQDRGAVWILFLNSDFTVASYQKIGNSQGNFTAGLDPQDYFGGSVANIGDLNNDGVIDLAVGAYRDDEGGPNHGAVYILFLNSNGTVESHQKINEVQGNFNETFSGSEVFFGISIDKSADINGDGLTEIIVGASGAKDQNNQQKGAFYLLNLNVNGTVYSYEKITEGLNNFTGPVANNSSFGFSVSYIGSLQENHCVVIGAYKSPVEGFEKGSAWVLQLGGVLQDVAANLDTVSVICNSRTINVNYTISNVGDGGIPANTPIAFYADNNLVGTAATQNNIPWGEAETGSIPLNIPAGIPGNFNLSITVDDDGTGIGTITEADENNNTDTVQIELRFLEIANPLEDLFQCEESSVSAEIFDLTVNTPFAIGSQTNLMVSYYLSQNDADMGLNPISNPSAYLNNVNPQEIYVRLELNSNPSCYATGSFVLRVCKLFAPQGFSPNGDGINDTFEITGLYEGFPDFELTIFSRYGNIVYDGNNKVEAWDGTSNHGMDVGRGKLPTGTYFYVLDLNHPDFEVMKSWVYLMR